MQLGSLSLGTKCDLTNGVGGLSCELSKVNLRLYTEFYLNKDRRMGGMDEGNISGRLLADIQEAD